MELFAVSRREKRQTFLIAVVLAVAVFLLAAPAVEAAIRKVKLAGGSATAKVKDSDGDAIQAEDIGQMGLNLAPGAVGTLGVRTFAGGGGVLGFGDCDDIDAEGVTRVATVAPGADVRITGLYLTGTDATVSMTMPDVFGPNELLRFRATADNPVVSVISAHGRSVTPASIVFTCAGTDGEFVVVGQGAVGS
jgi:hypothetical protein